MVSRFHSRLMVLIGGFGLCGDFTLCTVHIIIFVILGRQLEKEATCGWDQEFASNSGCLRAGIPGRLRER